MLCRLVVVVGFFVVIVVLVVLMAVIVVLVVLVLVIVMLLVLVAVPLVLMTVPSRASKPQTLNDNTNDMLCRIASSPFMEAMFILVVIVLVVLRSLVHTIMFTFASGEVTVSIRSLSSVRPTTGPVAMRIHGSVQVWDESNQCRALSRGICKLYIPFKVLVIIVVVVTIRSGGGSSKHGSKYGKELHGCVLKVVCWGKKI